MKDNCNKRSFKIYYEPLGSQISELTDEDAGKLFKAIFYYSLDGIEPEFDDKYLRLVFAPQRNAINIDKEKYLKEVEQKREAAKEKWRREREKNDADAYT